jgi:uncharacterized membrane protein required for colicin V production
MGFVPAWLNPLDVIIVFALLAGVAFGFVRGLIRMALSLLVLYVAAVLAMTFYDDLGRWVGFVTAHNLSDAANEVIAFLFILIVTAVLLTFVLNRTYKDTELPGVRQIDQLGGLVIGFFLTTIWIGLAIVALAFLLKTPIEGGGAIQQNVTSYFHNSSLIPIFYKFLPLAFATLKPWMPRGQLPEIFTFRLF